MSTRSAVVLGALATLAAALAAAGSASTSTSPPPAKGTLGSVTWAVYREPNSVDPIFAFDYPENATVATMCEALLRQRPDGTIVPGLAASVTNPDPLTYRIVLRRGVRFWDGSPLTAADVVFSLERARNPKLGGFYSAVFDRVKSIAATSPTTVTITLTRPDYWLRGELASNPGMIVEKRFALAKGKDFGTVKAGTMCTGAFKFGSWKTGQGVTVVRNDAYWNRAVKPKVRRLTIVGSTDDATTTSGLETGAIDGIYPQALSTLDTLRKSSDVHVYEGPSFASDAFIVSNLKGALGDVRVRKALSLALDRQGIAKVVYHGTADLPRTLANKGTWGYARSVFQKAWNASPVPARNLDKAKALVKAAGATGKSITIGTSQEVSGLITEASALQSAAQEIGLKAKLYSVSAANYINFFIDPKARACVDGWFTINYGDYADPAALYKTLALPSGSQDYSGWSNPQVTKALDAARAEPNPTKRAEDVVAAQKVIDDQLPWIPVVNPRQVLIMNKRVTGAPVSFTYMFSQWAASIGAAG